MSKVRTLIQVPASMGEDKVAAIDSGMESVGGTIVPGDEENEFDTRRCECCGSNLAGYRARCAVICETKGEV